MRPDIKNFLEYSTLFFFTLALIIIAVVKMEPTWEAEIFMEDGVVEDASAACDALGAILGFLALSNGLLHNKRWLERMVLLTMPLLSLFCFLDEISWGARIFHLHMPPLAGGGEFDGVHDVFVVIERMLLAMHPQGREIALVSAAVIIFGGIYWQRKWIANFLVWFIDDQARRCLGAAVLLLAFATFADMGHGRIISSLEEYSEMAASFYLALTGWYCLRQTRSAPALQSGAVPIA